MTTLLDTIHNAEVQARAAQRDLVKALEEMDGTEYSATVATRLANAQESLIETRRELTLTRKILGA